MAKYTDLDEALANPQDVTELDLSSNYNQSSLPTEIGQLTNLTSLNLSDNDLENLPAGSLRSVFFQMRRAGRGQEFHPDDYTLESLCASGNFIWYIEELDLYALIDHEDFDCLYGPCTLAQLEERYREIHESDEWEEAVGNDDVANPQPDSSGAQQAIQIDPNDAIAHSNLADIQGRKLKKSVFFAGILVLILILLLYIFIFRWANIE